MIARAHTTELNIFTLPELRTEGVRRPPSLSNLASTDYHFIPQFLNYLQRKLFREKIFQDFVPDYTSAKK